MKAAPKSTHFHPWNSYWMISLVYRMRLHLFFILSGHFLLVLSSSEGWKRGVFCDVDRRCLSGWRGEAVFTPFDGGHSIVKSAISLLKSRGVALFFSINTLLLVGLLHVDKLAVLKGDSDFEDAEERFRQNGAHLPQISSSLPRL